MGGLFDGLIGWSIRHRWVVLLCTLAFAAAAGQAASQAPTDALPDFTPPRVIVQTEAAGMGTLDVEELVTRPVERVLQGTPWMTGVRSTSSPGLSVITVTFEDEVDIYRARQLVTERLQLVTGHLPEAVSAPQLAPISAPVGALLKLYLTTSKQDAESLRALRTFADWTLRPRLLSLRGVAQVMVLGGGVERVEVRPDPARMKQRGVTLEELATAVRGSQAVPGAGFVEVGEARLDVHNEARLTLAGSVPALQGLSVKTVAGAPVRLGDIAEVVRAEEPRVGAALYDGRPAIYIQVNKLPWEDTREVTRHVEAALRELAALLPEGARLEPPVFRQASFVRTSLLSVGRAMGIGAFLVVVVLLVFLRSGRLAAISLTAIPLSILAATAVLVWRGVSINGMTLGGLAIAVGEVVDDAIIDVENVWRRLRENARLASPRPALAVIRDASKEIRGSVVYATLLVCLVLTPVLLLGGVAGRIFAPLAQAYILAIAASLFVALTVTPALCAWLLPRIATAEVRPTRLSVLLVERYRRLLRAVVERPRRVLAGTGVLVLLAAAALPFLSGRFLPEFNEGILIATATAMPGTSLEESTRLAERMDAQVRPEVAVHAASRVGRGELDEDAAP
ncbi:MAG: efflux RND transporter permease subunit, partial [Archangium sp.]